MDTPIKVKCKRCGRAADSNEFVLDPIYRMLVCPNCVKERRSKEAAVKKQEEKPPEKPKPAGWDIEDEYLEKAHRAKIRNTAAAEKIDDTYVNYKCPHCGYQFKYNTVKRSPGRCPYCSSDIFRLRFV